MKGPLWSLSPPPKQTPAHPYDNIPMSCLMTEITVYEAQHVAKNITQWMTAWEPDDSALNLGPHPRTSWWAQAKHLTSLLLWARVSASMKWGYGQYLHHAVVWPFNEWMSVCYRYCWWGGSVLCGSAHLWAFEKPIRHWPPKGSTPEGGSSRSGMGPRKLPCPRGTRMHS